MTDTTAPPPKPVKLWEIPAGTPPRKCERCPEMVYFVRNEKTKKPMPLSVEVTLLTKNGRVYTGAYKPGTINVSGRGFSHFANCPHAAKFRK